MANGYIGKISAIVTASTADLSRKLQGSTREVNRFANSIKAQIGAASRSAQSSFNDIFTAAQKVERALQAGTTLRNRRGIALIDPGEADRIRRVVSVAQGINRPAIAAKRSFESLSLEIRGALQPALERMQRSVDFVNRRIEVFGTISEAAFGRTQRTIRETTIAINQLAQAQQRLSTLATGNELEFSDPRLAGNLAAAQRAGQQALALPTDALAADPQIAGLIQQINAVATRATEAGAKVKASIGNPAATATATREYERLNAVLERLIARANRKISVIVDTDRAQRDFKELEAQLNQTLTGRPQNFKQVEAAYQRLRGEVERFAVAQRGAFSANLGEAARLISVGDERSLQRAADLIEEIERDVQNQKTLNLDAEKANKDLSDVQEKLRTIAGGLGSRPADPLDRLTQSATKAKAEIDKVTDATRRQQLQARLQGVRTAISADASNPSLDAAALRARALRRARQLEQLTAQAEASQPLGTSFGPAIDAPRRQLEALASRVAGVKSQLDALPASVRSQFVPAIAAAEQGLQRLARTPGVTAQQLDLARQKVQQLEAGARRAAAAFALPSFSEFTENLSTRRAVGELDALQQVLIQIGATAGGPAAQAYERYRARLQQAISTGTVGLPLVRRELVKLQVEAAKTAAATGRISFNVALRSIQRGGDIGRGAFQNIGLAAQQAAFGVEDFFSVTGGLDQRLRAAGNNISQLGFLLGGTTGLFIGIGTVLAAQVIPPLVRWAFETDKAEEKQKQLEAAIRAVNNALERQAQLTESIAEAFRTASEAAADLGASQEGQEANRRRREIAGIREEQRQRREAIVEINNQAVSGRRGQIDRLQERLGEETDGFQRVRIQQQIARLEAAIAGIVGEAERTSVATIQNFRERAENRGITVEQAFRSQLDESRRRLQDQLEVQSQLRQRGVATPNTDRNIAELNEVIAKLESALQRFLDDEALAGLGRQQAVAGRLARAGGRVGDLTFTQQAADRVDRDFEALNARQGQITEQQFNTAATRLEALSRTIDLASVAVGGFQRALDTAAGELIRTVAQESSARVDTLRRQANQAEARFGADDSRTGVARQAADSAQQAANEAIRRRIRIEDAVNQQRSEFDRSILEGRADPFVQGLANEIRRLEEAAANQGADPRTREAAASRAELLNQQLQEFFQRLPAVADLLGQADQADVDLQRQIQRDEDIARGLDLIQPANELADRLRQLELAADATAEAIADRFGGRVDLAGEELARLQQSLAAAREAALRQAAPAIFGLADQVANAVLQGPSRAALNATDVSTVEGSRELNRLLRGDDAARNQDLVQLQREGNRLLDRIARGVENNEAGVANN